MSGELVHDVNGKYQPVDPFPLAPANHQNIGENPLELPISALILQPI